MIFPKKQFTEENILNALQASTAPCMMLRSVSIAIGCKDQTAKKLLDVLVASGRVIRLNLGTEGKPTLVYYIKCEGKK